MVGVYKTAHRKFENEDYQVLTYVLFVNIRTE